MKKTVIEITLPEELAERAMARGLLSSEAIESYIREKLLEMDAAYQVSDDVFDPRLEGIVNPAVYRQGKILGDIIGPFHEVWGCSGNSD